MIPKDLPFVFLFWLVASAISSSCGQGNSRPAVLNKQVSTSYLYDLSHPQKKWELPSPLFEISGNSWIDNNHLLAIEDQHPNLYIIQLNNKATVEKTIPFKTTDEKKFDIEDVTIVNNTVYALWSHGTIFKITNWQSHPQVQELETLFDKKNNTEGICYNPVTHNLLIACKNNSDVDDEKKSTRAIYEFDLQANKVNKDPFLLIHKKDLEKFTGEKVDFYPSAVAVHPVTHDIYILSTRGTKCLVRYSYKGELKSFQFMDKDQFLQPEGICFAPDGTMFISSEGKHKDPAMLYQFSPSK